MVTPAHILLIGLRGSGKSTVGAMVAAALGRPFVDLDPLTAGVLGFAAPGDALRTLGEPAFRDGEHQALAQVLVGPPAVVALGGGTPTHEPCAELIRALTSDGRVRVLYLRASPAVLRARLSATDLSTRPGLLGGDPLAEIEALHTRRDPLYLGLAQGVVAVDGQRAEDTAASVLATLRDVA